MDGTLQLQSPLILQSPLFLQLPTLLQWKVQNTNAQLYTAKYLRK